MQYLVSESGSNLILIKYFWRKNLIKWLLSMHYCNVLINSNF